MALLTGYQAPGPVLAQFQASPAFARALIGPRRGGRKIAALVNIARRVRGAPPGNWRVLALAPTAEAMEGAMRGADLCFGAAAQWNMPAQACAVDFAGPDRGLRHLELRFFAADKPGERRRWRAGEGTVTWLVAARDLGEEACDEAIELAGSWEAGADREKLIVTSRMPAEDHWLARRFLGDDPRWQLFRQPGGLSPLAENRGHPGQRRDWYERLAAKLPERDRASEVDAQWRLPPDSGIVAAVLASFRIEEAA